jgi:Cu/Ag efflux protein CusF
MAGAAEPTTPAVEQPMPGGAVAEVTVATATVEAVDLEKRQVTLKGTDGKVTTLTVGEEVRNLPQVKVGDVVTFQYYQALAVALEPATTGARERVERVEMGRAPLGDKPAGVVEKTVDVTGTVEAIDHAKRLVTLRGPVHTLTLKVGKDVDLKDVKVGDAVQGRYIEGFAVSVEPPAAK